ncbi:MAG: hypothetical protein CO042_00370, partial [Parcubacteria group bacterium CG_4_9_14_0_2_um_filter_41_8]
VIGKKQLLTRRIGGLTFFRFPKTVSGTRGNNIKGETFWKGLTFCTPILALTGFFCYNNNCLEERYLLKYADSIHLR